MKVREPWLSRILDGSKTWELRSMTTSKRGFIGVGTDGEVHGTVHLLDVKLVGIRKGRNNVCPEDSKQDFWLRPENLDKHGCDAQTLCKFGWRSNFLYAWVVDRPQLLAQKVPYIKSSSVTWATLNDSPSQVQSTSPSTASETAPPTSDCTAFLVTAETAEQLCTGQSNAAVVEFQAKVGSQLHIYNYTHQRLEGCITVATVVACYNVDEAYGLASKAGFFCVGGSRAAGRVYLHTFEEATCFAPPVICTLQVRTHSLQAFSLEDAKAAVSSTCTVLPGGPAQRSAANHFLDRLTCKDLLRLEENVRLLDGKTVQVAVTCDGLASSVLVFQHTIAALSD